jgi:hypothetical protein
VSIAEAVDEMETIVAFHYQHSMTKRQRDALEAVLQDREELATELAKTKDYLNRLEGRIDYRLGTQYLLSLQGDVETELNESANEKPRA